MNCGFELTDIDWSNQDINVVEFFSKKFNAQDREIAMQGNALAQKDDIIVQKGGADPAKLRAPKSQQICNRWRNARQ